MMRTTTLLILLSLNVHAQWAALDTATNMIGKARYTEAIELLRGQLKQVDQVAPDLKARGHYTLSDALMRELARERAAHKNDLAPSFGGYIYEASDHVLEARKLIASAPGLAVPIKEQVRKLKHELTLSTLDNIRELEGTGDPGLAIGLVNSTERATRYMILLDSNFYLAYDYLGQALMLKGDSLRALDVLLKGISAYMNVPQSEPDAYAGYMVYRAATVQMYALKELDKAQATLQTGMQVMDADMEKVRQNKNMTELRRKLVLDKLTKTYNDLTMLQYDLYMLLPELTATQTAAMAASVAKDSTNINLRSAYAKVLNRTDPEAALSQYEALYKMYPRDFSVVFNLGAMTSNRASALSRIEPVDNAAVSDHLRRAFQILQEAEAIEPTNKQLMSVLAVVTKNLGLTSKSKAYALKAK